MGVLDPLAPAFTPAPRAEITDGKPLCSSGVPAMVNAEVICPQPRRAASPLFNVDLMTRDGAKENSILSFSQVDATTEELGVILGKNDGAGYSDPRSQIGLYPDSPPVRANHRFIFSASPPVYVNQPGYFFTGSPPVRASNPMVHDPQFVKNALSSCTNPSPLGSSFGMKTPVRAEVGSPSTSCAASFSSSPKVRIEGFSCGSSDRRCTVYTIA